ncbi:hypothetical protein [Clostridioides difficile]|nr:hypothetical protein [Clostridioides difficile]
MTNKEMCQSKNLGKEICGSCINVRRDCDIAYENWLEKYAEK